MSKIYFVTEYADGNTERDLDCFVSALTVSSYIRDCIIESPKNNLTILSTATSKKQAYITPSKKIVSESERHIYLASLRNNNTKCIRVLNQLLTTLQIMAYIYCQVEKDDYVLIYHSYGISRLLYYFRKIIKRKYILFVGEIYNAVNMQPDNKIKQEIEYISGAYGYIYANDLMNEIFSFSKPFAICYSSYKNKKYNPQSFDDGKIHIVYAGKIARKVINDAFIALECAKYLDDNYHIHILGYGDKEDLEFLNKQIEEINKEESFSTVSYDGCLSGEEYDDFLSKCQIGLCTRTLQEPYSHYCFPSKTVIYLSHNLVPICPNIEALRKSAIADDLLFVDTMEPKEIAKCILANSNKTVNISLINQLDLLFKDGMNKILE